MTISTQVRQIPGLATRAAASPAPTPPDQPEDQVELATEYPRPLAFVPTAAGTLAMVALVGSGTAAGAYLAGSLAPGAAVQGGAAGMLGGMVLAGVAGYFMDRQAEEHYAQTGEGTAWMRPAFTPEDITGMPVGTGIRGPY